MRKETRKRHTRRDRRKAKESAWRREPKQKPKQVGHGPSGSVCWVRPSDKEPIKKGTKPKQRRFSVKKHMATLRARFEETAYASPDQGDPGQQTDGEEVGEAPGSGKEHGTQGPKDIRDVKIREKWGWCWQGKTLGEPHGWFWAGEGEPPFPPPGPGPIIG